ncbi:hypothetical protein [Zymobacter sp. IVIA_5232.4 C2]|uniref:hypothetical protein n=1 Tax=Zymobacter sp. IVIA_5232.4 C2 TaxID=3394855 RepID=UPI0039C0BAEF
MTLSYQALVPTGCLLFITAPISVVLTMLALCWAPPYADKLMLLARWVWLPTAIGVFLSLIMPLLLIITDKPATTLGVLLCRWASRRSSR